MSTTLTFNSNNSNMVRIQNLVKKYDGRYVRNPSDLFDTGRSQVEISFEDMFNAEDFQRRINIVKQPYF